MSPDQTHIAAGLMYGADRRADSPEFDHLPPQTQEAYERAIRSADGAPTAEYAGMRIRRDDVASSPSVFGIFIWPPTDEKVHREYVEEGAQALLALAAVA